MSELSDSQNEKLILFISTVGTDDMAAAKSFLEATSWDVSTAMDRWFSFGGDASKLAATSAPSATSAPVATGGVGPSTGAVTAPPQRGGGGSGAGWLADMMGATKWIAPTQVGPGSGGGRTYIDPAGGGAAPAGGLYGDDSGVRAADRMYQERMIPAGVSIHGPRKKTKDMSKEWTRGKRTKRTDRVAAMFGIPNYRFSGDWAQAKQSATEKNKWLLVNINHTEEFVSHCLNRDLFNDSGHKEFIDASFVLFQYDKEDADGRNLVGLYKVYDFPFLAIMDPDTGRKELTLAVATADKYPAHATVIRDRLMEFISANPNPSVKHTEAYVPMESSTVMKAPVSSLPSTFTGVESVAVDKPVEFLTEEEQMARVLAMSMQESGSVTASDAAATTSVSEVSGVGGSSSISDSTMTGISTGTVSSATSLTVPKSETSGGGSESDDSFDRAEASGHDFDADMREVEAETPVVLDPEPPAGDKSGTAIRFRLPDGRLLQRRFHKQSRVEQLFRYIELNTGHGHLTLAQTMPRMVLNDQKMATLEELGLMRATLVCSIED